MLSGYTDLEIGKFKFVLKTQLLFRNFTESQFFIFIYFLRYIREYFDICFKEWQRYQLKPLMYIYLYLFSQTTFGENYMINFINFFIKGSMVNSAFELNTIKNSPNRLSINVEFVYSQYNGILTSQVSTEFLCSTKLLIIVISL